MTAAEPSRREALIALGSLAPVAYFVSSSHAGAAGEGAFMHVSRVVTGTDALSAQIGARIEALLTSRSADFPSRLGDLVGALRRVGGARDAMLGALSAPQVETALAIARPWYLGYVGDPSDTILKDDAAFTTFLQAQSYQKIIDVVPRPTYPGENAGWWSAAPAGVQAPPMPEGIQSWTFHPPGPATIQPADPAWKAYALGAHASIEDARRARPA